jgi:hypothetical protein
MEKVLLPKEVADALTWIMERSGKSWITNFPSVYKYAKKNKNYQIIVDFKEEKGIDILLEATVRGYDTLEDRILAFYNQKDELAREIIKEMLEIQGLKIQGINS